MASKGFRVVEDRDNGFNAFMAQLGKLQKKKRVKVGIQGVDAIALYDNKDGGIGDITMARLAAVHEFGATINNAFGKGITVTIPQRSFLRSTADENRKIYKQRMAKMIKRLLQRPESFNLDGELLLLGEKVRKDVIKKIKAGIAPPLSRPRSGAKKRESVPLIDTGMLVGSISAVVE